MASDNRQEELDRLIRKAQSQPGIIELMRAYGRYDEVVEQSRAYIERRVSQLKTVVSNNTC